MYALGRYGTYCVGLKYNDEKDKMVFTAAAYAAQGFDKHHQTYIV